MEFNDWYLINRVEHFSWTTKRTLKPQFSRQQKATLSISVIAEESHVRSVVSFAFEMQFTSWLTFTKFKSSFSLSVL